MLEAKAVWGHTCIAGGLFVREYNKKIAIYATAILLNQYLINMKTHVMNKY